MSLINDALKKAQKQRAEGQSTNPPLPSGPAPAQPASPTPAEPHAPIQPAAAAAPVPSAVATPSSAPVYSPVPMRTAGAPNATTTVLLVSVGAILLVAISVGITVFLLRSPEKPANAAVVSAPKPAPAVVAPQA